MAKKQVNEDLIGSIAQKYSKNESISNSETDSNEEMAMMIKEMLKNQNKINKRLDTIEKEKVADLPDQLHPTTVREDECPSFPQQSLPVGEIKTTPNGFMPYSGKIPQEEAILPIQNRSNDVNQFKVKVNMTNDDNAPFVKINEKEKKRSVIPGWLIFIIIMILIIVFLSMAITSYQAFQVNDIHNLCNISG